MPIVKSRVTATVASHTGTSPIHASVMKTLTSSSLSASGSSHLPTSLVQPKFLAR